jgi:hypothetical protein
VAVSGLRAIPRGGQCYPLTCRGGRVGLAFGPPRNGFQGGWPRATPNPWGWLEEMDFRVAQIPPPGPVGGHPRGGAGYLGSHPSTPIFFIFFFKMKF